MYKKAMTCKDITLYNKYRNYRKVLTRLKMFEKRRFHKNLFVKIGKDSKTLWSVLNSLIGCRNNKQDTIELIQDDS